MILSIQPMQWAQLPELHQTPPLDDSDLDSLKEIREGLSRHGKLARFAVHLAHLRLGEVCVTIRQKIVAARFTALHRMSNRYAAHCVEGAKLNS